MLRSADVILFCSCNHRLYIFNPHLRRFSRHLKILPTARPYSEGAMQMPGIHWKDVKKIESEGVEEKQMLLWLGNILRWQVLQKLGFILMLCLVFLQPGEAIFSLSNVSLDFLPAFLSRKKRESATSKVFFRFLFFSKKRKNRHFRDSRVARVLPRNKQLKTIAILR